MSNNIMFFNGWAPIVRTVITGIFAYFAIVVLLRVSSKRTLSRMTAFDLIIPLTLGPILADMILLANVVFLQAFIAFALLIVLHSIMARLLYHFPAIRKLVKREPALLLHKGEFLKEAMKRERVTEEEINTALRANGIANIDNVEAVVLEADGSYNVVTLSGNNDASSLNGIL